MADEPNDAGAPPATETPDSTPQTSPEPEQTAPASFGEGLRAAMAPAPAAAVDFDTRLATERDKWQKEADEKYGWAKDYQPETVQSWRQAIEEAQNAPVAVATRMLAAALASNNQAHRQEALSFAGKLLASRPAAPQAQPASQDQEPPPDVPAKDAEGNTIPLYSAAQLKKWNDWNKRQFDAALAARDAKLEERIKPFEDDRSRYVREREDIASAHAIFDRMVKRPGFKENQPEIYKAWVVLPGNDNAQQARENLDDAYVQVVFGKLQASAAAGTAADAARRAAASTGRVVTSQPSQASPSAPTSFAEKLAEAMKKQKGA
jgi:hypothetical protein